MPDPIHAGGLRYHGMSPLLSHMYELGLFEAVAKPQSECFAAGLRFARTEGILPAPEPTHALAAMHRGGAAVQGDRRGEGDPDRSVRAWPAGPSAYGNYQVYQVTDFDLPKQAGGRPGRSCRWGV